jgi:hypothetical protein
MDGAPLVARSSGQANGAALIQAAPALSSLGNMFFSRSQRFDKRRQVLLRTKPLTI